MKRVLAGIVAGLIATAAAGPGVTAEPAPAVTQDRLTEERMRELVARPMAIAEHGDLARAERALDALLKARAHDKLAVADTLTAFAVGLYELEMLEDEPGAATELSRRYLERAVAGYRVVFGDEHPEVALALRSLADVTIVLSSDELTPESEALLEEALRIRRKTLGLAHVETIMNVQTLAGLQATPERVRRDPGALARSEALLSEAASALAASAQPYPTDLLDIYETWAGTLAANGQAGRAVEVFRRGAKAAAEVGGAGVELEYEIGVRAASVADTLEEGGHAAEAEALRTAFPSEFELVEGD